MGKNSKLARTRSIDSTLLVEPTRPKDDSLVASIVGSVTFDDRIKRWSELASIVGTSFLDGSSTDWSQVGTPNVSNEFDIKGVIDESQLEPVQTANGRVVVYLPEFDIFILRGAIDWFAKAIHTYDAAFSNASTGYRTWSTSVLYQSSMFAMQAIVGFLGYAVCSDGGKRYIIRADLTRASDRETYPEWLNRRNDGYRDIVCLNERFLKHTTLWKLFKRVVVQTKNLPSAEAVDELIEHYGSGQFIPERHKLHYNQQYWIFDDWLGQWRTKPGLNVEKSLSETLARADEDVSYGRVVKYSSSLLMCLLEISKALADISAQYTVGMHDLMEYAQSVADEHKLNVLSEITLKD